MRVATNNSITNTCTLKAKQKELKQSYLEEINEKIFRARESNDGRVPHNFVKNIVEESKVTFPWVTRDVINKSFKKYLINKQYSNIKIKQVTANATSNDENRPSAISRYFLCMLKYFSGNPPVTGSSDHSEGNGTIPVRSSSSS